MPSGSCRRWIDAPKVAIARSACACRWRPDYVTVLALGGVVAGEGAAQLDGFLGRGDGVSPVLLWHDGPSPPDGHPSTADARGQTRPARLFRPDPTSSQAS